DPAHQLLLEGLGGAQRLVAGGHDHVLQHLDVVGVDGGRVDHDPGELAGAGDGRGDHAAAGRARDLLGGELLLRLGHLLLHGRGLAEHLLLVAHDGTPGPSAPRRTGLVDTLAPGRTGDAGGSAVVGVVEHHRAEAVGEGLDGGVVGDLGLGDLAGRLGGVGFGPVGSLVVDGVGQVLATDDAGDLVAGADDLLDELGAGLAGLVG